MHSKLCPKALSGSNIRMLARMLGWLRVPSAPDQVVQVYSLRLPCTPGLRMSVEF